MSNPVLRWNCTRCHWSLNTRPYVVAPIDPVVSGSFAQADVSTFYVPLWGDRYTWRETIVAENPHRIELEMSIDGVDRVVTFDDDLSVLDVSEPDTPECRTNW